MVTVTVIGAAAAAAAAAAVTGDQLLQLLVLSLEVVRLTAQMANLEF